jgi:hypothetical protein
MRLLIIQSPAMSSSLGSGILRISSCAAELRTRLSLTTSNLQITNTHYEFLESFPGDMWHPRGRPAEYHKPWQSVRERGLIYSLSINCPINAAELMSSGSDLRVIVFLSIE